MSRKRLVVGVVIGAAAALFALYWTGGRSSERSTAAPAAKPHVSGAAPASPRAGGQAAARLSGKVTGRDGAPLAGAVVRAMRTRPADAADELVAVAGADGGYAFDAVVPGALSVSASAPGHLPAAEAVALGPGERRTLDLRLEAGGRLLAGTVTDATGGPIAGALVAVAPTRGLLDTEATRAAVALTGADGTYQVGVPEGRARGVASHPDYVTSARYVEVGAAGARLDFTLVPGGTIEGVVRNLADGAPVAGAAVTAERDAMLGLAPGETLAVGRGRKRVVAGDGGRFRVTGLEPGAIRLQAEAPGRASGEPTLVPLGVAEQVTGVELFLSPALAIRGVVEVEGGKPAAGAEVDLLRGGNAVSVAADAQGVFEIDGLLPDTYALTAGGADFLPSEAPTTVTLRDASVDGVHLVVRQGLAVRGRVEPPGLAEVEVDQPTTAFTPGALEQITTAPSTLAGLDGRFTLGPLKAGAVTLTARASDGRRGEAAVEVGTAAADDVVIRLEDRGGIAGRVVDGGGKPVAEAVVSITPVSTARPGEPEQRTTIIINGVDALADRAPVAGDGSFAVLGLAAGTYELTVLDGRGGRMDWARASSAAAPQAPVSVTLRANERKQGVELAVDIPDGVIRGVVLDPDGKPLPDAWVTATPSLDERLLPGGAPDAPDAPGPPSAEGPADGPGGGPASGEGSSVHTMVLVVGTRDDEEGADDSIAGGPPPVLTDAGGRFEIRGLRRGRYGLLGEGARGAARGGLPAVDTGADVTLRLSWLTELTGTVTSGGQPVAQLTVDLEGPGRRHQRFRDAGGRFRLARIDPGDYTVSVSADEGSGHAEVSVQAGKPATVAIQLVGHGHVVGVVHDAAGKPLAGVPVVAAPIGEGGSVRLQLDAPPPTTGPDGGFALDVDIGKHMLLVLGPNGPGARKPIDVHAGERIDVGVIVVTGAPE